MKKGSFIFHKKSEVFVDWFAIGNVQKDFLSARDLDLFAEARTKDQGPRTKGPRAKARPGPIQGTFNVARK